MRRFSPSTARVAPQRAATCARARSSASSSSVTASGSNSRSGTGMQRAAPTSAFKPTSTPSVMRSSSVASAFRPDQARLVALALPSRTLLTTMREIDRVGPSLRAFDSLLALDGPDYPIADPEPADSAAALGEQDDAADEEQQIGRG